MSNEQSSISRRGFIALGAAATMAQAQPAKKKVAAIFTMYTDGPRLKSHAAVIIGRLLNGYSPNGVKIAPRTQLVSMYTDQFPENDLSRGLAKGHGFPIYPTIKDAMTLGGDDLAVDAVCFVGEPIPLDDFGIVLRDALPWAYMKPRLYWAQACPCSAASRYHLTASA